MRHILTVALCLFLPPLAQGQEPKALDIEALEPAIVVMAAGDFSARFLNLPVQQEIAKRVIQ